MAYNYNLRKKRLSSIDLNLFKRAIFLAYKGGITTRAPLGYSGDDIVIYGEINKERPIRENIVSIRNYSGDAELLITDGIGNFLFYGRYNINLGVEYVANEYYKIFNLLKPQIKSHVLDYSKGFKEVDVSKAKTYLQGFELLKKHQEKQLNDLPF